VIPVDKPPGVTSRRVVDVVARAARSRACGHAGTLDPLASGVVVVCLGSATRLVDLLHEQSKAYEAEFLLGRSSPSDDLETPVEEEAAPRVPSGAEIEAAAAALRGTILQRPCDYSAVHVEGKRAYRLARKGRAVEVAPRPVHVARLEITAWEWPRLAVEVECSSGTYIRALGRDRSGYFNLGTGGGTSVREVVDSCRRITGRDIAVHEKPRRPGDPPRLIAASDKIRAELGWQPRFQKIDAIVDSAWAWHLKNPQGYGA